MADIYLTNVYITNTKIPNRTGKKGEKRIERTNPHLFSIPPLNLEAFIADFIKEQKLAQTIFTVKQREAEEREGSKHGERDLHGNVVRSTVISVAGVGTIE